MANNNNTNGFSAADIEKYHKGQLSNSERHALEKAALDDPFLADALEGYALPGVDVAADMAALKTRLAARIDKEDTKVVAMGGGKPSPIRWLRVAAAVVIIGGAGLLANQFVFNNKKEDNIAQTDKQYSPSNNNTASGTTPAEKDAVANKESVATQKPANGANPGNNTQANSDNDGVKDEKDIKATVTSGTDFVTTENASNNPVTKPAPVTTGAVTVEDARRSAAPGAPAGEAKDMAKLPAEKKAAAVTNAGAVSEDHIKEKMITATDKEVVDDRAVALNRKTDEQRYRQQQNNIFRGRVTDANNAGVPFANVSNIEDKVGTYTDVNGYFNLTSPDSVLDVQVKSIGFENNQVQLKNVTAANKIVLREDRNLSTVVISNQKPNVAARNRDAHRTLLEPEPADGWDKYDTYLANNLEIPEDIKTKQTQAGTVQISFEVDKYGEPINIRVEKSLCDKCDKEAIRLIKDGPKWKRNAAAKGRTTVTINF